MYTGCERSLSLFECKSFVFFALLLLYENKKKAEEQLVINNARMKQKSFIEAVTADNILKYKRNGKIHIFAVE